MKRLHQDWIEKIVLDSKRYFSIYFLHKLWLNLWLYELSANTANVDCTEHRRRHHYWRTRAPIQSWAFYSFYVKNRFDAILQLSFLSSLSQEVMYNIQSRRILSTIIETSL